MVIYIFSLLFFDSIVSKLTYFLYSHQYLCSYYLHFFGEEPVNR